MKKPQIIALSVILLLFVGIGLFLILRKKDTEESSLGTSTPARDDRFPLSLGSRGQNVQTLQTKMNAWMSLYFAELTNKPTHQYGVDAGLPMPTIVVDGIFGQNTLEFVRKIFGKDTVSENEFSHFKAIN